MGYIFNKKIFAELFFEVAKKNIYIK